MNDDKRLELINRCKIKSSATLQDAIEHMDKIDRKLLLVFENDRYSGLLSIGDIQRALLKQFDLHTSVKSAMRQNQKVCDTATPLEEIKSRIFELRAELMPVLSSSGDLVTVHFWEEFYSKMSRMSKNSLNSPVVIMAGGRGRRLQPITNVIPKPLVPIGERPIVEEIIKRFHILGAQNFYMTVNYRADMIRQYFSSLENKTFHLEYMQEDKPLGTAGSLSLIREKLTETFFVSNCDILIEEDYSEIKTYHDESQNDLTIVGVMKNYNIPYGTMEVSENCELLEIKEKPKLSFLINSGMYILEPKLLDFIPDNQFFHITDVIAKAKESGLKVGVFPVSEGSWVDMGQWSEYLKSVGIYNNGNL